MKPIEKIISAISPDWAKKRAIARHDLSIITNWSNTAYTSGDTSSRHRKSAAFNRSMNVSEESAAGEYGYDAMRLEAMDLYRNNPLARAVVETVRRYARQSKPRACTAAALEANGASEAEVNEAKQWDMRATDYFNGYWWNRADSLRRPGVTFGTMQDFFFTMQFVQGDLAFVWDGNGFQMVEGLQIRTPTELRKDERVKNGFRYNASGKMTHVYICDFGKYGAIDPTKFRRVRIESVLFCPWYWRPAQVRGVPRLHGVIDSLRDDEEIHDATKMKVKHEAMLLSVERAGSRKKAPGSSLSNSDGTETTYENADYGMRFRTTGKPGEDFMLAKGDSPNAQYVPLMEHDAMRISAGVGVPYKILMSLYDGSWSSNKAAQMALKVLITELWTHRRDVFCQRAYNIIISQAIRDGHLPPAPTLNGVSLFYKTEWSRPFFPQLDQQKEEQGRSMAFHNLTASIEDFADEQGTTAEALFLNHKKNIKRLKDDAEELGIPFELYAANLLTRASNMNAVVEES